MTPPSYETRLWISWIPWENTVQYQLVTLQKGQRSELPFGVVQHIPTPHRSTALQLTGMESWSQSQARDPRDP